MSIIKNRKLNPNCYVEDVLDSNGLKRAKILFDTNCNLIDDANDYLKELRTTSLISYNSISVVARELCHFYNYLYLFNIDISAIDVSSLVDFIGYLKNIEKKRNKYAIENSIADERKIDMEKNNIINLFGNEKLSRFTIARIANRSFLYLNYLYEEEKNINIKLINKINTTKKRKRILKRYCLAINSYEKYEINGINNKLITMEQIQLIKEASSSNNDYQRFLYLLLELTGLRIGEALGLKNYEYNVDNIRGIKGDIEYKDETWIVNVVDRKDNPHDSLTKGNMPRMVVIRNRDKQEFEMILERYLKYRSKKIKEKDSNWFFICRNGSKLTHNTAYRRFKRLVDKLLVNSSIKLSLHSYRHSFCTFELLNGTPIEFVAKMAGHKSSKTTYQIYIHYGGKEMSDLREKYEVYYNK